MEFVKKVSIMYQKSYVKREGKNLFEAAKTKKRE